MRLVGGKRSNLCVLYNTFLSLAGTLDVMVTATRDDTALCLAWATAGTNARKTTTTTTATAFISRTVTTTRTSSRRGEDGRKSGNLRSAAPTSAERGMSMWRWDRKRGWVGGHCTVLRHCRTPLLYYTGKHSVYNESYTLGLTLGWLPPPPPLNPPPPKKPREHCYCTAEYCVP